MKNALLLALMLAAPAARAGYVRAIGPDNYHVYDGALFSSRDGVAGTQNTTVAAILTHSPKDGSLLPKSWVDAGYAETWAPLVLGGSYGNGRTTVNAGPLFNFGPQVQRLALQAMNWFAPGKLGNLRSILTPAGSAVSDVDVTFSLGLVLNAEVVQGGHFVNAKAALRDPVRYFAGPALHF